jgi:hypothetical protein
MGENSTGHNIELIISRLISMREYGSMDKRRDKKLSIGRSPVDLIGSGNYFRN